MRVTSRLHGYDFRSLCLLALMALFSPLTSVAAQQPSIDDVRDAWEARQKRIKSAKFRWTRIEHIGAQSVPHRLPAGAGIEFLPEADTTLRTSVDLYLRDEKVRYAYFGRVYTPHNGGVRLKRYISVFDGTTSKNFHHFLDGDQSDFPLSGFVRKENIHWDARNSDLMPIFLTYRPRDEDITGVELDAYVLAGDAAEISGHTCYRLQPRKPSTTRSENSYWIAPDLDYNVLRIVYGRPGKPPHYTTDINYSQRRSSPAEWTPSAWNVVETRGIGRRVVKHVSSIVTDYSINEGIDESEFRFEFPPNTAVVDRRENKRLIARDNGEERIVTNEELSRGANYLELVATESGQALGNPAIVFRKWLRRWTVLFQRFWFFMGPELLPGN